MKLSKDSREFVELLNSTKVKYLLVGGHAVGYHGHPRFTGDIDFFVERSVENAEKLEKVFAEFGFASLGFKAKDFLEPGILIQLGRPPNRIDILTSIDAVEFADAWRTKVEAVLEGLPVFVISKELLIRNKQATDRTQDRADIEKIG
jgi:hypothetical protein